MKRRFSALLFSTAGCWAVPGHAQGTFAPTQVEVTGKYPRMASKDDFVFKAPDGRKWKAPKGTITDGLSIPTILLPFALPLIDGVWAPKYRGAALVHDAYCAEANTKGTSYASAKWQDVHWMFFQACVAGGAPVATAFTLYAAVMMKGPKLPVDEGKRAKNLLTSYKKSLQKSRELASATGDHTQQENQARREQEQLFEEQNKQLADTQNDTQSISAWSTETVSDSLKQAQFREVKGFINSRNAAGLTRQRMDSVLRAATTSLQQGQVLSLPE